MLCLKCGNTLPDDSLFCQFCGTDLSKQNICPSCGANLIPDSIFCAKCGVPLHPAEPKQDTPSKKQKRRKDLPAVIVIAGLLLGLLCLCVFLLRKLPQSPPAQETAAFTPAQAAQSVLYLECYDSTGDLLSQGSGFLIEDSSTLVTNYHVVKNVYGISAFHADGSFAADVSSIITYSEDVDLAVLALDSSTNLPPLPLGDSAPVCPGDAVFAIGYPLGLNNTLSDGIVSSVFMEDGVDLLQTTAPVSHGSSGGALGHSYEDGSCTVCSAKDPDYKPVILTMDMLQGTWRADSLDGIYDRSQQYVFYEHKFYFTFRKGVNYRGDKDANEEKRNGTYTIDGNTIYFSDGTVGIVSGNYMYISGITFYKR